MTQWILALALAPWSAGPMTAEQSISFAADLWPEETLRAGRFGDEKALERTPQGLKVALAPGTPKSGWAMSAPTRLANDFEITLTLRLDGKATMKGKRLAGAGVDVLLDSPTPTGFALAVLRDEKDAYAAFGSFKDQNIDDGILDLRERWKIDASGSIQLRIQRDGSICRFWIADSAAGEFRTLRQEGLGNNPVATIRVWGFSEAEVATATFESLRIRAARIYEQRPIVTTVDGERLGSGVAELDDKSMTLKSTPPRVLSIVDLDEALLEDIQESNASWLGQGSADLVQASGDLGGNGVPDIQIALTGLRRDLTLKQIAIQFNDPQRTMTWQLDVANSSAWRAALVYDDLLNNASVFVEPVGVDPFDKQFQVNVQFEEGIAYSHTVKATTHGSDQPGAGTLLTESPWAVAKLVGGDAIAGDDPTIADGALALATKWGKTVRVPIERVESVRVGRNLDPNSIAQFQTLIASPGARDRVLAAARDQALVTVEGDVQEIRDGKVAIVYEGARRTIPLARVRGVSFARRPPAKRPTEPFQTFRFSNGERMSGFARAHEDRWTLRTLWGAELPVETRQICRVAFHNGRSTYLSSLEPTNVEETPYFGRTLHYRRDQSLSGGPIKVGGSTYARGLAVHSRSALTYALDGQFSRFRCRLGIDDEVTGPGEARVRLLGDGRELFVEERLQAGQAPRSLDLSVEGVRALILEVDFGAGGDVGDRVDWADARVYRP